MGLEFDRFIFPQVQYTIKTILWLGPQCLVNMSDDFFDDLDPGPLDESFFQQVDTLEQVALSQHPRGRSTTTSTTRSPPSKRQKLDPQQKQQWPHDSLQLQSDSRPSVIAERLEAEGDHQSADLAAQWEQALANLEAENARVGHCCRHLPRHLLLRSVETVYGS